MSDCRNRSVSGDAILVASAHPARRLVILSGMAETAANSSDLRICLQNRTPYAELEKHGREAHDAWCIGFFIDNEIQWGRKDTDLAEWTLQSPDDQPAKIEFLRRIAGRCLF